MPIPKTALDKVPADKRAALDAALAGLDDFVAELESGYMRQSDYSQKMNAWQTEKATMQKNWDTAKEQYDKMFADWEQGEATREELKTAKQALADAEKKLKEVQDKAPNIDPSKVISPEQVDERLNNFGAGQVTYFTEAMDMAHEIEGLLKTRISPGTLLKEALAAKKTPKAYAEEKYELVKKREEAAKAAQEAHDNQIREETRSKTIAELSNPATRPLADSKDPFFVAKDGDKAKQPWDLTETPADEAKLLQELTAVNR